MCRLRYFAFRYVAKSLLIMTGSLSTGCTWAGNLAHCKTESSSCMKRNYRSKPVYPRISQGRERTTIKKMFIFCSACSSFKFHQFWKRLPKVIYFTITIIIYIVKVGVTSHNYFHFRQYSVLYIQAKLALWQRCSLLFVFDVFGGIFRENV
jgi:hypothetical protein